MRAFAKQGPSFRREITKAPKQYKVDIYFFF